MPPTAEAFMELRVDERQLKKDTEDALGKVDTTSAGRKSGKKYGTEFGKQATPAIEGELSKLFKGQAPGVAQLRSQLDALAKRSISLRASLDDKQAQAGVLRIITQLDRLSAQVATPRINLQGQLKAEAQILAMDAALDKLGHTSSGTGNKLTGLGANLGKLSNLAFPALIASGIALSPVLITVGAGATGLAVAAAKTISPILKAASATGGLQKNMATLTPVQQQMARELLSLEGVASKFSTALQPEVVHLWSGALALASVVLGKLEPVAKATGDALALMIGQITQTLRGGEWTQFWQFMAQQAGPDVKSLTDIIIDLLKVLPRLTEDFQPVAHILLTIVDVTLKTVGALDKLHLLLPLLGAAVVLLATPGGPLVALGVALGIIAIQGIAASKGLGIAAGSVDEINKGLGKFTASDFNKFAVSAQVNWAAVAASLKKTDLATGDLQVTMLHAAPVVGTLAGDMAILDSHTHDATLRLQAFDDEWKILVGAAVSDQQAVLNMAQAFQTYADTVKQSGVHSIAAQQAFLSLFDTMKSGLDALVQNGASVKQLNDFYTTNIAKLNALHGLTPTQRADVAGLTKDYTAWASSVQGLSGHLITAAGDITHDFLAAMSNLHHLVPVAGNDTQAFANAILKTGDNSRATAIDRQRLIADLVHSGVSAANAKALVNSFQGQIDALHGKSVNVDLTTSGKGEIIITGTGINQRTINTKTGVLRGPGGHTIAQGWLLSGGIPGVDSIPLLGMAGELVVPKHLVDAGMVDHLRGMIPGFAAGGVVGKTLAAENAIGSADVDWASLAAIAFAQAAVKASQVVASGFLGPGSGNYAADIATVLTSLRLPLSLVGNWLSQIQTESGGNLRAVNLTDSNAQAGHPSVGLLQLIPGTFAAFAGPYLHTPPLVNFGGGFVSLDPMAQIYAGIHYALARYDGSMAAVIGHGHGYHDGGPITEPIFGIGPSGTRYSFEAGESVLSAGAGDQIVALLMAILAELRMAPGKTAAGVTKGVTAPRGTEAQAARLGAR
jgi:hypothetical protein